MRNITSAAFVTALLIGASSLAMAQSSSSAPLDSSGMSGSNATSGMTSAPTDTASVRQKLQASGYSDVKNIRKNAEGWTANATKNGQQITLKLDSDGAIRTE